ncbi:MAG: thiamine pyrophosphate-dependent enzyme [Methanotrichaceae archaeon]|nr:thiamine pyrophosphate-dependent enzyme [Methanotrichaceae archaeon]
MNNKPISGLEAIKKAVKDSRVEVVTYVPGYPVTEVADKLCAEISVNEKVAMEIALGASATGNRSIVIVKQVGMNVLADPLLISVAHTIGSGLVVLVGDDLGPIGSQAEMDSRFYGYIFEIPVLDPGDPAWLYHSIIEAFELSENLRTPVIVRITSRLLNSNCQMKIEERVLEDPKIKFDPSIWNFTARGRNQKHHYEVFPKAETTSETSSLNYVRINGKAGIIASGFPATFINDLEVSELRVGYVHPLPWKLIHSFIDTHEMILIAEEPGPFIESQLRMSPKVRGRLTGHLPFGPLERLDLEKALDGLKVKFQAGVFENVTERGYRSICEDCPFAVLYKALDKLNVPVAGDAGCVIKATRAPYAAVDVVYGLGSSIAVASGFKKKGVAVIGDFALAHTGIPGIVNAVWKKRDVLVIVLQNGVAATTGGQVAPDLAKLLKNIVPTICMQLPADQQDIDGMLRIEMAKPATTAILLKARCDKSQTSRIGSEE